MTDTSDPEWNEIFDIFVPKGTPMGLLVMVMNSDRLATSEFFGRLYEYGITYEVQQQLEDGAGTIFFRMIMQEASIIDTREVFEVPSRSTLNYTRRRLLKRYAIWNLGGGLTDVGEVLIFVYRGSTIAQPYLEDTLTAVCCVELTRKLLWKQGQSRTTDPIWDAMFKM
ncbi:unnamed protein product [Ixodes hexagonus]